MKLSSLLKRIRSLPRSRLLLLIVPLVALGFLAAISRSGPHREAPAVTVAAKPALTVTATVPERAVWPDVLPANGSVVAWQESVISAEIDGYRIVSVDAPAHYRWPQHRPLVR